MIVLVAFLLRLSPVFITDPPWQPLLKEFDPYYFFRNVEYIINNGFPAWFSWKDYSAWYPFGRDVPGSTYPGMIFTAVMVYYFVNGIGISTSAFTVCYYMPLLFGTLTPIVVYLIGKEVHDRRSGLLAAFFIAVCPAIIQRQVVGFFDNEPFGIFVMLVAFYFFLRSLKRNSVPSAIMAGLSLGYICISWGTYIYVVDIFALFAVIMLLARRYSTRLFTTYGITMLLGLFIAVLAPRNGLAVLKSGEILPALFMLGLMGAYESSKYLAKISLFARVGKKITSVNPFLLAVVVAAGAFVILTVSPIGGKFYTVLLPIFRETQAAILASVGEHQPTIWAMFFYYLGIVVFLSIVGLYFSFRRLSDGDIFLILSAITLVYFSGSMIRIVITLSPILALLAGYGLSSVLRPFGQIMVVPKEEVIHRKRVRTTPTVGREYAAAAFLLIGVLLFPYGVAIISNPPHQDYTLLETMAPPEILAGGRYYDWLEALSWLNNEAPPGAVVVAWWDYGYYITVVGNRTSVDDNGTTNSTQIALVGLSFMRTNETSSLEIFRRFHADYVLVSFGHMQSALGGDEGKWIWMLRIAADVFPNEIDKDLYYNESTSLTKPLFFNTTLYRLMFNNEPSSPEGLFDGSAILAMGLANSPYRMIATAPYVAIAPDETVLQSINDNIYSQGYSNYGWEVVETLDPYGPRFFQKAFFSSNHVVKIYKIDYTPLEMMGNLAINASETHVYTNGTATITAVNIGGGSTPAIPLNYWSEAAGIGGSLTRTLSGSVWINGTSQVSISSLRVWNATTSSWDTHGETYYLKPGQSVEFRVTGLNSTMLTNAFNSNLTLPLALYSAYDMSIFARTSITVESSS